MKVVIGSGSPIKKLAVMAALKKMDLNNVEVECISVESGVGDQPVGTPKMEKGASTRAMRSGIIRPGADYYIGIENGLVQINGGWFSTACVFVLNSNGVRHISFTTHFPIPEKMAARAMTHNIELSAIIKEKEPSLGGGKDPMNYLSKGTIKREEMLTQALMCAFVPFFNEESY